MAIPIVSGKKLVLWFGGAGILVILATTLTFRFYGWQRFVANSRLMEGKNNVIYIARSVMACGEKTGALPETSPKVPADFAEVGGKTHASNPAEWQAPAFTCVGYTFSAPDQSFQYQWEKKDDTDGVVRARADFDGDGVAEATYEQEVICTKAADGKMHCKPGAFADLAK